MNSTQVSKSKTQLDKVYRGCLDDLPEIQSRVVRVFFSSTFTGEFIDNVFIFIFFIQAKFQSVYSYA